MNSDSGKQALGWLLGAGEARGIALVFLISGLIMTAAALLALASRSYKRLSAYYAES